jgi:hypothetical protein
MIDEVLKYLVAQLDGRLKEKNDNVPVVVLPATAPSSDSVSFADNQVTLLLLRIEEERIMRQDDPWFRQKIEQVPNNNGEETTIKTVKRMAPPIFLHLYVLLVSRNANYATAMERLSNIIRFFQARRVFKPDKPVNPDETVNNPWPNGLPELQVELHSPTFTTLNEIWSMLKSPLHPCVMYRLTLTLLEDAEPDIPEPLVATVAPGRELGEGQSTLDDKSPINTSFVNPLKSS